MGTQQKQAAALFDGTTRWRSNNPTLDRAGNSRDAHLIVGRDTPGQNKTYRSYIKFDFTGAFWTGVYQITSAMLVLRTTGEVHVTFGSKPRPVILRLTEASGDPGGGEGVWTAGYFDPIDAASTAAAQAWQEVPRVGNSPVNIDITSMVELWAPTSVRRRDGSPGGAVTHHGVKVQISDEATEDGRIEFYSKEDVTPGNRPYILLTYEEGPKPPNPPTLVDPNGNVGVVPSAFTGSFSDPNPEDRLSQTEVEVYLGSGGAKAWGGTFDASPSDATAGTFSVPFPASLKSLTDYEWRARVSDGRYWSEWSSTARPYRTFRITNTPPTLALVALANRATLASTIFRGQMSDADGDSLFAYQVQLRPGTLGADDAAWSGFDNLWDSGAILPSAHEINEAKFGIAYAGAALSAGAYSWRARVQDNRGAWSAWQVSTFSLTADFDPNPGSAANAKTGISPIRPPARVVFRGVTLDAWTIVTVATGGTWKITYAGVDSAALNYNASAANVKAALEGLIAGATATVNLTTATNTRTYVITLARQTKVGQVLASSSLTGSPNSLTVTCNATRAPGPIVAIVEDANGLGASKYLNSPGEFHMTLPQLHPAAGQIEPFLTHYSVQVWWGDRYVERFEGLVTDFDADTDSDDAIFYGIDYLGLLDLTVDERFDVANPDKSYASGGSKYSNIPISDIIADQLADSRSLDNSPVKFIASGTLDTFSEQVTIYSTYAARLTFIRGLITSHQQGTGKRSRLWVEHTLAGAFQWRLSDDVGSNRDNLRLELGGLVNDARIVGFGDFAVVGVGLGRTTQGTQVLYRKAAAPGMAPEVYGRIVRPFYYSDLFDINDLARRVAQDTAKMGRVGKQVALALRVNSLQPFDGYDVGDSFPLRVVRGIIDTTRYGSGYWTLQGVEWSMDANGAADLTLVLLPREDGVAPSPDLLPFTGSWSKEWTVGYSGPDPDLDSRYYLDLVTGNVWVRDFNTGDWILLSGNPTPYFSVTDLDNPLNVIKMEAGYLWYSTDGGLTWEKFWGAGGGTLPGGSNLIPDGSFEMAAFPANVAATATWDTDAQFNDTDPADGQRAALTGTAVSGSGTAAVLQLDSAT